MRDWVPLVTDWAPDGTEVSVCRDRASDLWLATSVDGTMQGGAQIPTWTGGEGWAASGGALPDGAEEAIVRHPDGRSGAAVLAGGCWLAIAAAGAHNVPVRFHDRFGRLVPAPARGELAGDVPDATEPCAACDAADWEERRYFDRPVPGDEPRDPHRLVRCRACGHSIDMSTFYAPLGPGEEPTAEEQATWAAEAQRDMLAQLCGLGIGFPVYGVEPAVLGGFSTADDTLSAITLVHGEVRVTTTFTARPDAPADVARRELADLLGQDGEPWPDLSHPALAVWLDGRDRRCNEAAARAPLASLSITVGGEPVGFLRAGDDRAWAAVARARPVDGRTLHLAVASTGPAPALEPLRSCGGATWRPEFE